MAKQTFTTGQVLTAAQMTSLQQTALGGGAASAKTASYTLVAADAGTAISMTNASATTITVNTGLFSAGDTVLIQNLGAGVCTVTAGSATVNTAGSLALAQYEAGVLYFVSASAAVLFDYTQTTSSKVVQIVTATTATEVTNSTTTFADTGLTATITPTSASNKVLVMVNQNGVARTDGSASNRVTIEIQRGSTTILTIANEAGATSTALRNNIGSVSGDFLDSPATTSATIYKTRFKNGVAATGAVVQEYLISSTIVLMEVTP